MCDSSSCKSVNFKFQGRLRCVIRVEYSLYAMIIVVESIFKLRLGIINE